MKNLIPLLLLLAGYSATAQESDTTIYDFVDSMPFALLNSCSEEQHPDWPEDSIKQCADLTLMQLVASNIQYPIEARQQGIEGTVVIGVVVEPDSTLGEISILKDIGSGCGAEAKRILTEFGKAGLRWKPGINKGKAVRTRTAIPLKFKLQEAPPYLINARGDSVYTIIDSLPQFKGGEDSLFSFVINKLQYPGSYKDSCLCGIIEMAMLVYPDGKVLIENQLDYSDLGLDFQFEAIRLGNRTEGLWIPATHKGTPVCTTYPIRVLFKSPNSACKNTNEAFDKAMLLANEAAELAANEQHEEALAKWNEAIELAPGNTELLYYRGNTYFALDRRDEACEDYTKIKQILGVTWFESIGKLLCSW